MDVLFLSYQEIVGPVVTMANTALTNSVTSAAVSLRS